jgi:predicted dehydrogenase
LNINVLIIGFGSIGKRHYEILKKIKVIKNIYILTKQDINNAIKDLNETLHLDINYIIIASETYKHLKQINWIDKNFTGIKVLVEKPLYHKFVNTRFKKNLYFVGYNMRFNPMILKTKELIKGKKIWSSNIICSSYLPDWKKGNYSNQYNASNKKGGGVLLDLSHEIDYTRVIFGDYIIKKSFIRKISNLKIKTNDIASIIAQNKKNTVINVSLNYYSKLPVRIIYIEGLNISLVIDLISKKIRGLINKKIINLSFSNYSRNYSYMQQHKSIINGNYDLLCNMEDAKKINKIISNLKK